MLRPSSIFAVAACLGALLAAGLAAGAHSAEGFFDLSVRGKITKRWTYVEYNPGTECAVRRTFRGRETFTFRSRRPTRVLLRSRADGGLALGAILRNISGTYAQTGTRAERSLNACKDPVAYSARCAPPRRSSNRGTISVSAPRRGVIQLAELRLPIRLPRAFSACEPRAVAALATQPEIATARARADDVFDANARAVELDAGASEITTFSGGDSGQATIDVSWTIAFERVGS